MLILSFFTHVFEMIGFSGHAVPNISFLTGRAVAPINEASESPSVRNGTFSIAALCLPFFGNIVCTENLN